jgi:hypothetical protein
MSGANIPDKLSLVWVLSPAQCTGGSHQLLENLGKVPGVQDDKPHAVQDTVIDFINNGIVYLSVGHMSPPCQNIRIVQDIIREPMVRLFQCGCTNSDSLAKKFADPGRDDGMHAVRINGSNAVMGSLMDVFAPNSHANRLCTQTTLPPAGRRRYLLERAALLSKGSATPGKTPSDFLGSFHQDRDKKPASRKTACGNRIFCSNG